jgi:hypothetical protein
MEEVEQDVDEEDDATELDDIIDELEEGRGVQLFRRNRPGDKSK